MLKKCIQTPKIRKNEPKTVYDLIIFYYFCCIFVLLVTLRRLVIVHRGGNNEYTGGTGGPGTGFCSPGGGFSDHRHSGKPLHLQQLKKPPPGPQKPVPGPPGPPRDSLLTTPLDDH